MKERAKYDFNMSLIGLVHKIPFTAFYNVTPSFTLFSLFKCLTPSFQTSTL